jgi:hypothetical protein
MKRAQAVRVLALLAAAAAAGFAIAKLAPSLMQAVMRMHGAG